VGMLKEFKEFAMRGNVIDMAVGVIIGGAFGKIVNSMVNDVIMPPIGVLMGKQAAALNDKVIVLDTAHPDIQTMAQAKAAAVPYVGYGPFLSSVIDFTILAFCIFLMVKAINSLKRPAPAADPTNKDCPYCLLSIPIKATRCGHCTSDLK
jgi:large conductance mechanosensitive channel